MTKINRFHSLGMILIAILTILDIVNRGIPVTWSNFTFINVGMIFSIILYTLDVATNRKYTTGKYRSKPLAFIALVFGLLLGIFSVLVFFNF